MDSLIEKLEYLRTINSNPMELFASCLRSVIQAREGTEFFCGDFSSIEVRVLFWVAEHEKGLQAYRKERDLYREISVAIFGVPLSEVTKDQREIGKRAILGCGYGMGHVKFRETCIQYGQPVTEALAKKAVFAYRIAHSPVPQLWYNLEQAAISAVKQPGKSFKINRTNWFVKEGFLWCELPSGRRLAYYKPRIGLKMTDWGEQRDALPHGSKPHH